MVVGKRYQVFSIKETKEKEGRSMAVWSKAGSAFVNRDGSINIYLDVLPLDGKLHVREVSEKNDVAGVSVSRESSNETERETVWGAN
jgi:hypothetical protein